jgi:hypothetical protein
VTSWPDSSATPCSARSSNTSSRSSTGPASTGKNTLAEAATAVFGDYARPIDPGLLIDRGDVHPTGTASLFGLRLAVTHETDARRHLAEGTVKRLTGGDKITARRMREDFWDFDPSHSIIVHTNHKPIVRGTDEGIWRRLRFVPFAVVIPEEQRDTNSPNGSPSKGTASSPGSLPATRRGRVPKRVLEPPCWWSWRQRQPERVAPRQASPWWCANCHGMVRREPRVCLGDSPGLWPGVAVREPTVPGDPSVGGPEALRLA